MRRHAFNFARRDVGAGAVRATDVFRSSLAHGVQFDAAYRWNFAHATRFGLLGQTEHTRVVNGAIVLPTDDDGNPVDAPFLLAGCSI